MPTRASAINSVQKSCRILRSLTEPRVSRLSEIAAQAGLNKVTTLRILEVLSREGFIRRDDRTKTYSLGNEVFILAASLRDRDDLRARARPSLVRLAAVCEDSILLSVRSGAAESVCVDKETGSFPIRANYLDIGSRRPLGIGAGAMALLAWQSEAEIEAILPLVEQRLPQFPKVTMAWLKTEVARSRERGYSVFLNMLVDRMGAIGVPILGADGRAVAAISIAALSDRLSSRMDQLADMLKREAEVIGNPKRT
ncbi:MAG TPA: IclR family transcriptional regulator [Burkholderiales bacterium]|nr:IclR family transcriptional regulator [Burkholderiales bacterium]